MGASSTYKPLGQIDLFRFYTNLVYFGSEIKFRKKRDHIVPLKITYLNVS